MLGQEHTPEYFVMGMYLSKMTECISHVQLAMTKYDNKKEKERERSTMDLLLETSWKLFLSHLPVSFNDLDLLLLQQ